LDLNGVACARPSTCVAVGDHDMAVTGTLLRTIMGDGLLVLTADELRTIAERP
jgi:hypothetical protein